MYQLLAELDCYCPELEVEDGVYDPEFDDVNVVGFEFEFVDYYELEETVPLLPEEGDVFCGF